MSTPTAREVSAGRVKERIAAEEERFRQARPRSQKLWQEARERSKLPAPPAADTW